MRSERNSSTTLFTRQLAQSSRLKRSIKASLKSSQFHSSQYDQRVVSMMSLRFSVASHSALVVIRDHGVHLDGILRILKNFWAKRYEREKDITYTNISFLA